MLKSFLLISLLTFLVPAIPSILLSDSLVGFMVGFLFFDHILNRVVDLNQAYRRIQELNQQAKSLEAIKKDFL